MKEVQELSERLQQLESKLSACRTLMTFKQAQNYLGFSKHHLHRLCYRNKIPHHQPTGRTLFFFKEELDKWVSERPGKKRRAVTNVL